MKHNPYTFRNWLKQFAGSQCAIWDLATDCFDIDSKWEWNNHVSLRHHLDLCGASEGAHNAADAAIDQYAIYLDLFHLSDKEVQKYYPAE